MKRSGGAKMALWLIFPSVYRRSRTPSGRVIGASKIARDITERKQAQERQELLTQEIHHRTKNIFSLVQAVIARSFADKSTVEEAKQAVLSRLHSLAQTHVMLIDKEWQGADIADVVRAEMSPMQVAPR